jgi:hypothetical protein
VLFAWADRWIHRLLYRRSPVLLARCRYRSRIKRRLDLANPVRLDEKLVWLMLNWHDPLKTTCTDKLGMRAYVADRGYAELLSELYGVYERSSQIDFDSLPDSFVLKCNHGSRFNIVCPDKCKLDVESARLKLDRWLKQDFSLQCGELHYSGIEPRILCERYLGDSAGNLPRDYKLHCFHGRVEFTMVCSGRRLDGRAGWYDYYDRPWKKKLAFSKSGIHLERHVPEPASYSVMLKAAEALSSTFPYVRMDFFEINGAPILGEMTFTPAACTDSGYTDVAQTMGALLTLPRGASATKSSSAESRP